MIPPRLPTHPLEVVWSEEVTTRLIVFPSPTLFNLLSSSNGFTGALILWACPRASMSFSAMAFILCPMSSLRHVQEFKLPKRDLE